MSLDDVCDGCGEDGAEVTMWVAAPLGWTAVHVHRDRACANAAREARGGGRFFTPGPDRRERAAMALRGEVAPVVEPEYEGT